MYVYRLTLGPCFTNTYIIAENGEATVIDPASDVDFIMEFVRGKSAEIKNIIATHGHFDHVSAIAELQDKCGAKVYMSQTDHEIIDLLNDGFGRKIDTFRLDVPVKEGDKLTLSGHTFEVMETPGHTPGSVSFIVDGIMIFTGDTLFRDSIGRTDFAFGDSEKLKNSLKRLVGLAGDYNINPGHGENTNLNHERRFNPYVR